VNGKRSGSVPIGIDFDAALAPGVTVAPTIRIDADPMRWRKHREGRGWRSRVCVSTA
jgi:hypothetical protein